MVEKQIIDCLRTSYGINVNSLQFLPLGADINASVYKAETGRKSYFIKIKRSYNYDISLTVAKLLAEAGIQQIILPIKTLQGQHYQNLDDFVLIVYPFMEGENGFIRPLTEQQWLLLGKALRQVHEIEVPLSIQNQIRKEEYSNKWRVMVRTQSCSINNKSFPDEMAFMFLQFMQENSEIINRLVQRAEELGRIVKKEATKFVLCHSDIHGGNVLIDEQNSVYIVDWDDPIMAPKERDLMFIGGGVANVWNQDYEEQLFYKGYGLAEINSKILSYYRHERIVEDIAQFFQQMLSSQINNLDKQTMYTQFTAMFKPDGVVDIAFKTDVN